MKSRSDLQTKLETICPNVYYNPPASIKMNYPCIVYSLNKVNVDSASNKRYLTYGKYTLIHIYKTIKDEKRLALIDAFDYMSHDRTYTADGLYHDSFTLFW